MTSSEPERFENLEVEIEFCQPDPAVLDILTGGAFDAPTPLVSIEVIAPVKRAFWQWLLRKPRQHRIYYIPRARIEEGS
jgi:hypothetical protein